jgi:pentatricopeptide repeat protein
MGMLRWGVWFWRGLYMNVISWTSMVHGYCEDGDVDEARFLFDCIPEKNVLSWNVMMSRYSQNRRVQDALKLFYKMYCCECSSNCC